MQSMSAPLFSRTSHDLFLVHMSDRVTSMQLWSMTICSAGTVLSQLPRSCMSYQTLETHPHFDGGMWFIRFTRNLTLCSVVCHLFLHGTNMTPLYKVQYGRCGFRAQILGELWNGVHYSFATNADVRIAVLPEVFKWMRTRYYCKGALPTWWVVTRKRATKVKSGVGNLLSFSPNLKILVYKKQHHTSY